MLVVVFEPAVQLIWGFQYLSDLYDTDHKKFDTRQAAVEEPFNDLIAKDATNCKDVICEDVCFGLLQESKSPW